MAIIIPELSDLTKEVFPHERVEAEKEGQVASDEDFDDLEMDFE
jgi:hypothetical protein